VRNKEYDNMFYLCWLVERMHRTTALPHAELVTRMGKQKLQHYFNYAEVFHCENPDQTIGELAEDLGLPTPPLYSELSDEKDKPRFSKIAKSAARIIREVHHDNYVEGTFKFFTSFLPPLIADYPNNLYWSSKEYLVACYQEGKLL